MGLKSWMLLGMTVGWAGFACGQSSRPLVFSEKTLALVYPWKQDTLQIHNPNPESIRCDSVALLLEQSRSGLFNFDTRVPGGQPGGFHLYPQNPAPQPGGYRSSFPYSFTKLDFPANKTLDLIWRYYDACPACKRSAAEPVGDTIRFQLVLYYGIKADTVQLNLDKRLSTGIMGRQPHVNQVDAIDDGIRLDALGRQSVATRHVTRQPLAGARQERFRLVGAW